jgi:phytoene dehydrogenase-like protein
MADHDVIIIGAGLAGLAAATTLAASGREPFVVEASDAIGGRVRTDLVEGYRLDRGFQILLTAYPEARRQLDLDALELRRFAPGAMVRIDGRFHRVSDPLRRPLDAASSLAAPIGSVADKLRVIAFRRALTRGSVDEIWDRPGTTARERLRRAGFSDEVIERFYRPLVAGITLAPDLDGSSRVFEFVFRMLATGDAAVPADGMGTIPAQLAASLPSGSIRLGARVDAVSATDVEITGARLRADTVVLATDVSEADRLTGIGDRAWRGTTTVWLSAPEPPIRGPWLVLDGDGRGPITNLAVMSQVSERYAPPGCTLVAASVPSARPDLTERVTGQLRDWFGAVVDRWEVLRVDQVARAQPVQPPDHRPTGTRTVDGIVIAGDHLHDASINGALASGRAAAEAILAR